jgi:hypothetical protein
MPRPDSRWWVVVLALVTLLLLFGIIQPRVQDARLLRAPQARVQDADAERHPAHIHEGSCATLGGIAIPLNDVAADGRATGILPLGGTPAAATALDTPMAMSETVGSSSTVPFEASVTVVDVPLEQIADGQHAINVHRSAEEIDTSIACGNIGGQMMGSLLVIGLQELNDSEVVGTAMLDAMDDQTRVVLVLLEEDLAGVEP